MNNASSSCVDSPFEVIGCTAGSLPYEIDLLIISSGLYQQIKAQLTQFHINIIFNEGSCKQNDQAEPTNSNDSNKYCDQSDWHQLISLLKNSKYNILLYSIIAIEVRTLICEPFLPLQAFKIMFSVGKKMKMEKVKILVYTI